MQKHNVRSVSLVVVLSCVSRRIQMCRFGLVQELIQFTASLYWLQLANVLVLEFRSSISDLDVCAHTHTHTHTHSHLLLVSIHTKLVFHLWQMLIARTFPQPPEILAHLQMQRTTPCSCSSSRFLPPPLCPGPASLPRTISCTVH